MDPLAHSGGTVVSNNRLDNHGFLALRPLVPRLSSPHRSRALGPRNRGSVPSAALLRQDSLGGDYEDIEDREFVI